MTVFNGYRNSTYYLLPKENPFTIGSSGSIVVAGTDGQSGVDATRVLNAVIDNAGGVVGGAGFIAGVGIYLQGGQVTNSGAITGGAGDPAYFVLEGGSRAYGDAGYGGAGIRANDFVQITNSGSIQGGQGGNSNYAAVPEGGFGGAGLELVSGGIVNNSGTIHGGGGGYGGPGGFGLGGTGGAGITALYNTADITNTGAIIGGAGGQSYSRGGDGIDLGAGGTIVDSGAGSLIEGGKGIFPGGAGGDGVNVTGGTVELGRDGTIEGGGTYFGTTVPSSIDAVGVYLDGGTLVTAGAIKGGGSNSDSVFFDPSASSTMLVSRYATFKGAIGGFKYGDSIDLTNLSPQFVAMHFNAATDTITTTLDGTLQFAGDPTLIFSSDGNGGTIITTPCFRRGTHVTTEHGERAIESLEIGDRVLTKGRELKPIRWIGRRHYAGPTLVGRRDVLPVLIRAGALGAQLPRRDLWVSPEHAMYLNGALVPAGLLTNGASILTDDSVGSVTYYHLEFDEQEVIFAEGAPAESFVDDDSRRMFDNAADYSRRYPAAPHKQATFCAPRLEEGFALEILRAQLAVVTGAAVEDMRAPSKAIRELRI